MNILQAVSKFKEWESSEYPCYKKYGEWECDYDDWQEIYALVDQWINNVNWGDEIVDSVLFFMARDNECEIIRGKLSGKPDIYVKLAKLSLISLHSDAKWQLATLISENNSQDSCSLLHELWNDKSYYVQRICMMESAKLNSPYSNKMIEWAWLTHDEYQRISALWSLYWINDKDLLKYLHLANELKMEFLVKAAGEISQLTKLRNGPSDFLFPV